VIEWAKEKVILEKSTPEKQFGKTLEEFTELYNGVINDDIKEIKDGIGDVVVTLIILGKLLDCKQIKPKDPSPGNYTGNNKAPNEFYIKKCIEYLSEVFQSIREKSSSGQIEYLLIILSRFSYNYDLTIERCLEHAYNEIKGRKGKMVNGIFVKEE